MRGLGKGVRFSFITFDRIWNTSFTWRWDLISPLFLWTYLCSYSLGIQVTCNLYHYLPIQIQFIHKFYWGSYPFVIVLFFLFVFSLVTIQGLKDINIWPLGVINQHLEWCMWGLKLTAASFVAFIHIFWHMWALNTTPLSSFNTNSIIIYVWCYKFNENIPSVTIQLQLENVVEKSLSNKSKFNVINKICGFWWVVLLNSSALWK